MVKTRRFKTILCLVMAILLNFFIVVFGQEETAEVKGETQMAEWVTKAGSKIYNGEKV